MQPILEIEDLSVDFHIQEKPLHAVSNISFQVFEKTTLGIVGESGCGKTATATALMPNLPSLTSKTISGKVLFEKKNILLTKKNKEYLSKSISMIFQDPMTALNPTMKIGKQIAETLTNKKDKTRVFSLLKDVGLLPPERFYHSYPHLLSGGQRQRVLIAIALGKTPKILIADEPTTALDVTTQAQILSLLQSIQKKTGLTIILITHDLRVVADICDKVIIMYAGKIIEEGATSEILKAPLHPYTQLLVSSNMSIIDKNKPKVSLKEALLPCLFSPPKGCPFANRCPNIMNICLRKSPHFFHYENKKVACWLYDKRA